MAMCGKWGKKTSRNFNRSMSVYVSVFLVDKQSRSIGHETQPKPFSAAIVGCCRRRHCRRSFKHQETNEKFIKFMEEVSTVIMPH